MILEKMCSEMVENYAGLDTINFDIKLENLISGPAKKFKVIKEGT